jgi:NAD(P)-dependent dehydrogenase (short-subunit alcohol dehydrogenase family)
VNQRQAHHFTGINLEFARILLKNGANVVIGDLSLRPEAQKLFDEYNGDHGPKALFVKTDVTSWSDLNHLFQKTEEQFGTFDIVCPGAGVFEPLFSGFWSDSFVLSCTELISANDSQVPTRW